MQNFEVYTQRRELVRSQMGSGVLVVFAAPVFTRNNDVEHEYRQHSDFYYLTGLDEPDSVLVLSAGEKPRFMLFVRPRDVAREVWDGPRVGVDGAVKQYGADEAFELAALANKLPELLKGHQRLYFRLGEDSEHDQRLISAMTRSRQLARRNGLAPTELVDSSVLLHELRVKKSEYELSLMRKASEITTRAHHAAMAFARPGRTEYEVEAVLRQIFRASGSERCAYAPIVGSGNNATILHYMKNDQELKDGDLLLIDAGCEYKYYAADVTRTFPVNGKFSPPQKRLYEIVLEAQVAAIAATKPGSSFDEQHAICLRIITEGLIRLGLIEGPLEIALAEERYKPFFMHKTGHYLGMDVHDVGTYFKDGRARPFEAGMVLTVEPGVYVAPNNERVPAEYRGIGIRIEDDVLVTENGHENLSADIVKSIEDIERVCSETTDS